MLYRLNKGVSCESLRVLRHMKSVGTSSVWLLFTHRPEEHLTLDLKWIHLTLQIRHRCAGWVLCTLCPSWGLLSTSSR